MDWAANVESFSTVTVTGLAILLTIVSAISYLRLRSRRALLIGFGFLTFAAKGGFLTFASFQSRGTEAWILVVAILDLIILLLLYLSIRVR